MGKDGSVVLKKGKGQEEGVGLKWAKKIAPSQTTQRRRVTHTCMCCVHMFVNTIRIKDLDTSCQLGRRQFHTMSFLPCSHSWPSLPWMQPCQGSECSAFELLTCQDWPTSRHESQRRMGPRRKGWLVGEERRRRRRGAPGTFAPHDFLADGPPSYPVAVSRSWRSTHAHPPTGPYLHA